APEARSQFCCPIAVAIGAGTPVADLGRAFKPTGENVLIFRQRQAEDEIDRLGPGKPRRRDFEHTVVPGYCLDFALVTGNLEVGVLYWLLGFVGMPKKGPTLRPLQ